MKARAFAALCSVFVAAPADAAPRDALAPCRGASVRAYVGKPYLRLQRVRPDARYVCSTCPMTMDYRRDRLTVTYDERTGRVTSLRCV